MSRLAAAVVNFQTPDLLETAVRSFSQAYPDVPLLVVDNGSADESRTRIRALQAELGPSIETLFLNENIYHGPAMHRALAHLDADFVYVFDSDTETRQAGFLERMVEGLAGDDAYAAGQVVRVDRRGFAAAEGGIPVLASAHMLLKRDLYLELPPFIHHGLPALQNFAAAHARGLRLLAFPIHDYVHHFGRGTAARYGYGLGLRSKLDYLLHRLGW